MAACTGKDTAPRRSLEMLLLGTGTSSALPAIGCLTSAEKGCLCCRSTLNPDDAAARKNVRRNTSAVLLIPDDARPGARDKTLLIDVRALLLGDGKPFSCKLS